MAITRTAHLDMVDASDSATNTQAFDCSGGTTLVVFSENVVNTAGDTTGATYNGVAMTEFARIGRPSQNREIVGWYLHNPASGSNNIVATRDTASGRFVISAFAYSGTDTSASYTTGDGNAEEANGTGTTATISFTNDGGEATCGVGVFSSGGQAGGTDTTLVSTSDIVSDFEGTTLPASANDSLVATLTNGGWAILGISVKGSAQYDEALTVTAEASASFVRGVGVIKTVTAEATASFIRDIGKNISVTAQAGASFLRQIAREMLVTAQGTPTLVAGLLYAKNLFVTAQATASFTMAQVTLVALTVTAEATATIGKLQSFLKDITATAQASASVSTLKTFSKIITATAQATASVVNTGLSLSRELVVTASATVTRTVQKALSQTITATGQAVVSLLKDFGYIDKYPENDATYEDKYPEN